MRAHSALSSDCPGTIHFPSSFELENSELRFLTQASGKGQAEPTEDQPRKLSLRNPYSMTMGRMDTHYDIILAKLSQNKTLESS
jgi:hypothetical protein